MNLMSEGKNMREDDNEKGSDNNPWARSNGQDEEKGEGMRLWGIFLFSLIGATVTTFAVSYYLIYISQYLCLRVMDQRRLSLIKCRFLRAVRF